MPDPGLALLLRRAEHGIRVRLQPVLDELELGPEHWRVLSVLADDAGTPMALLAEAAVLPPASLTRHVDRLVERDLVVRRIDPMDRRRVVVALSARGVLVAARLRAEEELVEADLVAALGEARWRSLTRDLTVVGTMPR